jgi:hypothetical protein
VFFLLYNTHMLILIGQNLKDRISSPFGFQHLTHTDRHQFATLRQVSKDELVAEYWAVRAAQAPRRDLTGIKAEDLHTGSHSSPALGLKDVSMGSEPISKQEEHVQSLVTPTTRPTLRSARSVESFSRPGVPGVKPQLHRHTQSANAPPRSSSRSHMTPMNCLPEDSAVAQRSPPAARRPSRQSGNWEHFALSPSSPSGQLSTMTEEADYVGHALTTPDNSAIHPNSPPFTPGLDDVAEEPERFVSPRAAPQPPVQDSKPHKSPSFDSFSFSKQQSPIAKSYDRRSPYTSPKSSNQMTTTRRSSSQISDTLGSPGLSRKPSVSSPPTTRTKSNNTWRVIEESWEDDIDYIYDNALEADCDFDWDSKSFGRRSEDVDRTAEQQVHNQTSSATCYTTKSQFLSPAKKPVTHNKFTQGAKRPVLVVPSANHAPEPRSAVSTSTIETPGAHTPSDFYNPLADAGYSSHLAEGFCLTPSLLIPQDFKNELAQEENYDDLFEDYEESDRHFPLIETNSTRSSHVRSSKRSSDDSSFMSSGQASGSWTSGVRRSASSSGSLPELVHSSRHARENFNSVVDHLSQQVASFTSFDEHDDEKNEANMTPPGHTSQQRTFFAFDDEQVEEDHFRQASVKDGVKNSLELARQGSTRSRAPLPNHKYSNSDGATKMLMSASSQTAPERQPPTKSRHRAASSSNVQRKPREKYFNLFPTPPRHSPLSTPTTTPLDHASMRL